MQDRLFLDYTTNKPAFWGPYLRFDTESASAGLHTIEHYTILGNIDAESTSSGCVRLTGSTSCNTDLRTDGEILTPNTISTILNDIVQVTSSYSLLMRGRRTSIFVRSAPNLVS